MEMKPFHLSRAILFESNEFTHLLKMRSDLVYCIHLIYSIHVIYLIDGKVIYPFIIIYPFTPNPCSYARHPSSAAPAAAPAGTKGACTFWILLVIPTIYKAYF